VHGTGLGIERLRSPACGVTTKAVADHVAFTLWPESDESSAIQNLRTAIYEVRSRVPSVLAVQRDEVSIAPDVEVDLSNLRRMSRSLQGVHPEMAPWLIERLGGELLPDWYDDWIIIQRERWLQARLHGLDSLAAWLTASGMHALAIDAAISSVMIEPFREGGRRALIGAYLAEGDPVAAAREYHR
jgi:DNA-binding SARP family transcriptional activator